jgi:ubiquitin-conjugating enzyme E2 J1
VKEATELSSHPSLDYHAEPLESNLFEWHFTIRGPPSPSPFASGLYHGRIVLPNTYPLRPPSFRFLTPSGRFEVNREICLSISGHHEETWQPAWGIRTALVAIRSFMDTEAKGQLGGLDCSADVRRDMARQGPNWRCATCAKTNGEIMKDREKLANDAADRRKGTEEEEEVPKELRLAYRDELTVEENTVGGVIRPETVVATESSAPSSSVQARRREQQPAAVVQRQRNAPDAWIDKMITAVGALLAFMLLRKLLAFV